MAMVNSANIIMEERVEEMVSSPTQRLPTKRIAHFLKPSIRAFDPFPCRPEELMSSPSNHTKIEKLSLDVSFNGWRTPQKDWNKWVSTMHEKHHQVWKNAGIYHAVLNSKFEIPRHENLVLWFAQKWCPDTKSFVLPWGESTITLEDLMILGGYSVLGDPVFRPVQTREEERILEKLHQAKRDIYNTTLKKVIQSAWMAKFMNSGSTIEHEAFLALWLSRFVFASVKDVVIPDIFPIAIHLARGGKMALAPAVLATLYRDLTLLRTTMDRGPLLLSAITWAPFQFVQVWIWERFPLLRPVPEHDFVENGEPRLARWHKKKMKHSDLDLDTAVQTFYWRPYVRPGNNPVLREFYRENIECWAVVVDGNGLGEEFQSFAWCLRVSKLVGLENCVEDYLPHRVSRQFGMDQDIPANVLVEFCTENPITAWAFYSRPVGDERLYFPPRFFESEVTLRYKNWWSGKSPVPRRLSHKKAKLEEAKIIELD